MTRPAVQCGDCTHFGRDPETGHTRCSAQGGTGGEGSRRWPFLVYDNFPIVCGDHEPRPDLKPEPATGQRALDLEPRS